MAHMLTQRANTRTEMAYVGDTPWHGLGQVLTAAADIDTWKREAGMEWQIKRSPVRYGEGPEQRIFDDRHVLFRSDTKAPLGIVSPQYKVVHPGQVLEFFSDLVGAAGFRLETAGTMFGGARFWGLARVSEDAVVVGQDRVGGYLLLSTSCDGSLATEARFTTVRVVCHNTLSMALGVRAAAGTRVAISHRTRFDPAAVKARLGVATDQFAEFMQAARHLARKPVRTAVAETAVEALLTREKVVAGDADKVKASPAYQRIMGLFAGAALGGGLSSAEGTAWGLVNAVTEYVDHHSRARAVDNRLANAWYGRGDTLKTAALEAALAL